MVDENDDVISYKLMSTMGSADVKVYKCTLLDTQQYTNTPIKLQFNYIVCT